MAMKKIFDRFNFLSDRNDDICAYCDDCMCCPKLGYDGYSYKNADNDTEWELGPICGLTTNERNFYQSKNDATFCEAMCERLRELNSPDLPAAHNKYMEILMQNIDGDDND